MFLPMCEYVIPLLTAHLVADFLIQSDEDVKNKSSPRVLLKHSLIAGLLSWILLGFIQAWYAGLFIFLSHAAIDYLKSKKSGSTIKAFLLDQGAHLLVIVLISYLLISQALLPFTNYWVQLFGNAYYSALVVISGAILCVPVGGIIVGFQVKSFLDQLDKSGKNSPEESEGDARSVKSRGFENGGITIGYLERALTYLFVLVNQPAGIGFLIAAKSVFRFGELKESSNRMEAEYIIIGTLYSFLYGILISYAISKILIASF